MSWLILKYLLTAAAVVLVSETAKRSDQLGGVIAALRYGRLKPLG